MKNKKRGVADAKLNHNLVTRWTLHIFNSLILKKAEDTIEFGKKLGLDFEGHGLLTLNHRNKMIWISGGIIYL
ncbi:unnamed protein product [Camellia sinensis]